MNFYNIQVAKMYKRNGYTLLTRKISVEITPLKKYFF